MAIRNDTDLIGNSEGKRPYVIHVHLNETGWVRAHCVGLPVPGSCEHGDAPSGPIKCGGGLDHVSNYQLLKQDSAARSEARQIVGR
jgi:hypothetical protein